LNEFAPKIFVVRKQLEGRRQPEVMTVFVQQLETKRVDRPKPGAIESAENFGRRPRAQYLFPSALLHFVSSPIREGQDNKAGQRVEGLARFCKLHDTVSDRARLARARGRDHRKIPIELGGKTKTL
jgi:hypothetical protein